MRKIKLYIAISLNGKIARSNGDVDWLEAIPNPKKLDYGYADFYESVDTTIQGFNTYRQIIEWNIPFPYQGKKNFVLTSKTELSNNEHVDFISKNHVDFIKSLKNKEGKDIWLIGGANTNTKLLNAGLIDEIWLYTMPIIIPEGINLFESIPSECHLNLISSEKYETGVVSNIYNVKNI